MPQLYLCKKSDVPPDRTYVVNLDGEPLIIVYQVEGLYYAASAKCPHHAFVLKEVPIANDCSLQCPSHNWIFDARTGKTIWPDAKPSLQTYTILETNDALYALMDS